MPRTEVVMTISKTQYRSTVVVSNGAAGREPSGCSTITTVTHRSARAVRQKTERHGNGTEAGETLTEFRYSELTY